MYSKSGKIYKLLFSTSVDWTVDYQSSFITSRTENNTSTKLWQMDGFVEKSVAQAK